MLVRVKLAKAAFCKGWCTDGCVLPLSHRFHSAARRQSPLGLHGLGLSRMLH